jgi:hypothetical protein
MATNALLDSGDETAAHNYLWTAATSLSGGAPSYLCDEANGWMQPGRHSRKITPRTCGAGGHQPEQSDDVLFGPNCQPG